MNELRARTAYTTHDPIIIQGDAQFNETNGVTPGGAGTPSNPYVIEGWDIDANLTMYQTGILIMGTTAHYVIRGVHVSGAGTTGIALSRAPNGAVEGCLLDSGDTGLMASDSDSLSVTGNTVTDQDSVAIEVMGCEWANITDNTLSDNDWIGIAVAGVENVTISSNTCVRAYDSGVWVYRSRNCSIVGNNASEGLGEGVFMDTVNDTLVYDNDFTLNEQYGAYVTSSSNLTIYHNRFIGNGVQAHEDNSTGVAWDALYPLGGNYWSDYAGPDAYNGPSQDLPGPDGIGDTPYVGEEDAADWYPWMTEDMAIIPEFVAIVLPVIGMMLAVALGRAEGELRRKR